MMMMMGGVLCVGWSKRKSHACCVCVVCLCLSACPRYTATDVLWKALCVGPRTSHLLSSAKQWKWAHSSFFTITAALLPSRFLTHAMHTLLHSATFFFVCFLTAWISLSVPALILKCGGNGSYFLHLSADNWIKWDRKTSGGDRQQSLKVNITSPLNPFWRKWDFPYSSMFCLDPSTGEETISISVFLVTYIQPPPSTPTPSWERETDGSGRVLKRKGSAEYPLITCLPMSTFFKGFIVQQPLYTCFPTAS